MLSLGALLAMGLGLGGFILNFFDRREHPIRFKITAGLLLVLFVPAFWIERNQTEAELLKTQSANDSLRTSVDTLTSHIETLAKKLDAADSILTVVARKEYPSLPDIEALRLLSREGTERQALVATDDFYRVLRNFDTHYKTVSFDSASRSNGAKMSLRSGAYLQNMIRFAEFARRTRDNLIDSSVVRIEQLGVSRYSLRYEKRLPIRTGQALKSIAQDMELEPSEMAALMSSDSL